MIVKRDQVPWQMGVESEVDFLRVPVAQRMETTMDGLLASSSSFITPFSYGFFDDVNPPLWGRPPQVFRSIRAATPNTWYSRVVL